MLNQQSLLPMEADQCPAVSRCGYESGHPRLDILDFNFDSASSSVTLGK